MNHDILGDLVARWPSAIIARAEVKKFTGGGISAKTLANADSQGTGPEGRFLVGRRVCYPVSAFVKWLQQNIRDIGGRE